MKHDEFGKRMKKYEYITRDYLIPRMPVIIRIDGKAFHTFTRGFARPFDDVLVIAMQRTMLELCRSIQGCVCGYTQSDEISLLLVDYKRLNSMAWFDGNIQKCASISASIATFEFNRAFQKEVADYCQIIRRYQQNVCEEAMAAETKHISALTAALDIGALFDSRVFNLPQEEVCNYFYWRQQDAIRNSVQMVGQAYYSSSQLHRKSQKDIIEMLEKEKGIRWSLYPTHLQRGSCCIKRSIGENPRQKWCIDQEIPVFLGDDRQYIESMVNGSMDWCEDK